MASNKNNNANVQESDSSEVHPANNHNNNEGRPIFSLTMDPNVFEQEVDQAARALQHTMNSLFNSMQSSVFGGFESLQKEMSAFERSSKEFMEQHPFHSYHHHFPWSFRTDGPKKRYRITIEELPPLEDEKSSRLISTTTGSSSSSPSPSTSTKDANDEEETTITQGKVGTPDEGKTVITTSMPPGLLDWLLFTTHDDSFFRRLGRPNNNNVETSTTDLSGAKITELSEAEPSKEEQEAARQRMVPGLVEKVKEVGSTWERGARHLWQRYRGGEQGDLKEIEREEQDSRGWPRGRSWGFNESFSQTTVTRPDGTIEHRSVCTIDGETETVVKIQHPDGTVEETVNIENNGGHGNRHGRWAYHGDKDRKA
ncbi:hypothetical protein BGZ80_006499 [Entomortierella chlamydospora]|uniref:Uncharacterized protein n=1 Tax=Entomortierella chlamydospora TaxID=101097 RepID=A0A9P6MGX1_9FUNG|nr:hypothetical protein BGZ80_006499 [Entomortierella chlamydospora]KAG0000382.1 hypothetical protein BGZ79_005981 [Entomortierella chlamydospora]